MINDVDNLNMINGSEAVQNFTSPLAALSRFYYAFNHRDLGLMAQNWASSDRIVMDNPLGGIKRGWDEVGQVYQKLFSGPAEVYVEYYDFSVDANEHMFYTVGRERGHFRRGSTTLALAIRTSRIFQNVDGNWQQVHHHGSIDDPGLLQKYQTAVLG